MIALALKVASFLFLAWFFVTVAAIGVALLGSAGRCVRALACALWCGLRSWRETWPYWLVALGILATLIAAMIGGSSAAGITALSIGGPFVLYLIIGVCVIVVRDTRKARAGPIYRPGSHRPRFPGPHSWPEITNDRAPWDSVLRRNGYDPDEDREP